jgi:arginyl-tRNA synthetase
MPTADPISEIRAAFEEAALGLLGGGSLTTPASLEQPPREELGDYSSNAAMLLAGQLRRPPRQVGEDLADGLRESLGSSVERVEVAGPGFVNLHLSDRWFRRSLARLAAGAATTITPVEQPERTLVEFVSANPTGPLTAAGGRHAAYGDAVARLLDAIGHEVAREYYVNDAGSQIDRFAASISARMTGEDPPEDGYAGEYVAELAEILREERIDPADRDAVARRGVELMLVRIEATLERFGAHFDSWFHERRLHEAGRVEETLERMRGSGHVYESEGAVWIRSSALGDDKDRVLIRSSGEPTYLAADIAYHRDKLERGFGRLIDVLGADHHGYLARMRAAIDALDFDPDRFDALIMQLVHIVQAGGRAQMSKRKGEFVTLDDLLDDIGVDATRFFMLQRSHDTTVDLDLDLARRQSSDNPVYYVQYAHARIASIMRKAAEEGAEPATGGLEEVEAPLEPAERTLIKRLLALPSEVREAAERRAPHRLCAYSTQAAGDFHAFYRDCQVVGAGGEGVQGSRLALCLATKDAIAFTLGLLGISAPERM